MFVLPLIGRLVMLGYRTVTMSITISAEVASMSHELSDMRTTKTLHEDDAISGAPLATPTVSAYGPRG